MGRRLVIGIVSGLALLAPSLAAAQEGGSEHRGAEALGLALRRLETTKRVLMIGAHPDDEYSPLLATLALGEGAEVAYLSLTRGEGGQNLIGPELQEGLGIIRTEELLAARRLDGARQYFGREYDYGFSKSAAEAFRHWPRDSVLADVVEVIREFRPDVILSVWSGTPRDGHGQHQASGIIVREAYEAAADPSRFPGQVAEGLAPFRAKRLVQSVWRGAPASALTIETGMYDPLFGRSWLQIAMAGRSRHRSQDQGGAEPPGPSRADVVPLAGDTSMNGSLFRGVDTTLAALARSLGAGAPVAAALDAFDRQATAAATAFNPLRTDAIVAPLAAALAALRRADSLLAGGPGLGPLRFRITQEERDASAALRLAAGIELIATADAERIVPGRTFGLTLQVWNGGPAGRRIASLEPELPEGWTAEPLDGAPAGVASDTIVTRRFRVHVPADADGFGPWYLRRPRDGDMYRWPSDPAVRTLPFEPDRVRAMAVLDVGAVPLRVEASAAYEDIDKALGERRLPVMLVPAVSVAVEPRIAVVPLGSAADGGDGKGRDVTVVLTSDSPEPLDGTVRLEAPAGWRVEPASAQARVEGSGSRLALRFAVHPPASLAPGRTDVTAVFAADGGREYRQGYDVIAYPHTQPRPLFEASTVTFSAFPVAVAPGLTVGYIEGAGDDGPHALEQLGVDVELLDPATLLNGDLDRYSTIVTGIRAYEVRPELATANARLLEYVERGGTLVVQYNKQEYSRGNFAPWPLEIPGSAPRVTDEDAPVRLLDPSHPLLSTPNRIGPTDFEGWVQERGLYFPDRWDDHYTPLLEMNDPGEPGRQGSLLAGRYGRGRYVWVALSLFRELPHGVPGAYRLLANMVSWGH